MAELATLARPYAEALFQVAAQADAESTGDELAALAAIAANPQLRQFADDPKTASSQVQELIAGALPMSPATANLLRAVLDNGRLSVLPEIASQYRALVNQRSGVSEAAIYSAFPIDDDLLADVVSALERRFRRKLTAQVHVDPALIGGIRVVVGDEVLDTSVRSRLAHMKAALTA